MKIWKAKRQPPKHDVWVSEVRLRDAPPARWGKVMRLLAKLEKEGFGEDIR